MDHLEQLEWEEQKARLRAEEISASFDTIEEQSSEIIKSLREQDISPKITDTLITNIDLIRKEAANWSHRTYHIEEALEDSGPNAANRRASYIALRWFAVNSRFTNLVSQARMVAEIQSLVRSYSGLTHEFLSGFTAYSEFLSNFSPGNFEKFVADFLKHMGWHVSATGKHNRKDGSIDFIASQLLAGLGSIYIAGQIKHHLGSHKTGSNAVDRLFTWKSTNFHFGLLITNTTFTKNIKWKALQKDNRNFIKLKDLSDLISWMEGDLFSVKEEAEVIYYVQLKLYMTLNLSEAENISFELWPGHLDK